MDTYVKIYLMPDKHSEKSDIVKDSSHPAFNQRSVLLAASYDFISQSPWWDASQSLCGFSFEFSVAHDELAKKNLEVTVKKYESLFHKDEIGQFVIYLRDYDLSVLTSSW